MSYTRFAIYYLPPDGPLSEFGARWLGWDVSGGCPAAHLDVEGLDAITEKPRKYGFHATLKPPFHLAGGCTLEGLQSAVARTAETLAPAVVDGLELTALGRFLALTPRSSESRDLDAVRLVAARCVQELDRFRAPPDQAELARRRTSRLSPRQDALLMQWGYPYVMEQFRFHMTLTGPLAKASINDWIATTRRNLPELPAPFALDQIALCAERSDGRFELIQRYPLASKANAQSRQQDQTRTQP